MCRAHPTAEQVQLMMHNNSVTCSLADFFREVSQSQDAEILRGRCSGTIFAMGPSCSGIGLPATSMVSCSQLAALYACMCKCPPMFLLLYMQRRGSRHLLVDCLSTNSAAIPGPQCFFIYMVNSWNATYSILYRAWSLCVRKEQQCVALP